MTLTLIGCAGKKVEPTIDPAIEQLNQAASMIQADLEKLSRIKQANFEKVELFAPPANGPLAKQITLKWSGPLDGVLKAIASMIDFDFQVRGEVPASPVLVHVDCMQTPAFEVLEDLGWKAGKHQVSVDAENEVVQLTYFEKPFTRGITVGLQSGE